MLAPKWQTAPIYGISYAREKALTTTMTTMTRTLTMYRKCRRSIVTLSNVCLHTSAAAEATSLGSRPTRRRRRSQSRGFRLPTYTPAHLRSRSRELGRLAAHRAAAAPKVRLWELVVMPLISKSSIPIFSSPNEEKTSMSLPVRACLRRRYTFRQTSCRSVLDTGCQMQVMTLPSAMP